MTSQSHTCAATLTCEPRPCQLLPGIAARGPLACGPCCPPAPPCPWGCLHCSSGQTHRATLSGSTPRTTLEMCPKRPLGSPPMMQRLWESLKVNCSRKRGRPRLPASCRVSLWFTLTQGMLGRAGKGLEDDQQSRQGYTPNSNRACALPCICHLPVQGRVS